MHVDCVFLFDQQETDHQQDMARDVWGCVQEEVQVHGDQWCFLVVLRAVSVVRVEPVQEFNGVWVVNLHDGERSVDSGILRMCSGDAIRVAADVD